MKVRSDLPRINKRNNGIKFGKSRAILRHTLYTFALHLFAEAGWPGLGLVLVPLTLRLALRLLSGFVRLASRDPPLLLVFLVRRPLRGARPPRPLSLPPASGPSQRAHFAFPPPSLLLRPNCRFASFSTRVLDDISRPSYRRIERKIRKEKEKKNRRRGFVEFGNERTKVNYCIEETRWTSCESFCKKKRIRGELEKP